MFEDKIEELLNSIHDAGCDTIENVIIKSNISLIRHANKSITVKAKIQI